MSIRNDYIVDELPLLDQMNIKDLNNFTRGSLDTAINEIKHKYTSIDDDFTERTVIAQNNGLRIHKGDSDGQVVQMPMVSTRKTASEIVMREMASVRSHPRKNLDRRWLHASLGRRLLRWPTQSGKVTDFSVHWARLHSAVLVAKGARTIDPRPGRLWCLHEHLCGWLQAPMDKANIRGNRYHTLQHHRCSCNFDEKPNHWQRADRGRES